MTVRRRVFANKLSSLICETLSSYKELDFLVTISKGDLSLLPAPEDFDKFMPAVIVDPTDVYLAYSTNKSIAGSKYDFDIKYLKYYNGEYCLDVKEEAIAEGETIADVLMGDITLNSTILEEGRVIDTELVHIGFNAEESQIFSNLELPVVVININYVIHFLSNKIRS